MTIILFFIQLNKTIYFCGQIPQWELKIFFSDGHKPMKICGSNSYPYNFNKFLELLGIEPMEGEEDTNDE